VKYPRVRAFEAIAYAAGPDGKAHTDDDVPLGMNCQHAGRWRFLSTPDDDDIKSSSARWMIPVSSPNVEGPNPQRKSKQNNFPANNYGDVWIAATYKTPDGKDLKAKAYLVVTIPNYPLYDQPEVAPPSNSYGGNLDRISSGGASRVATSGKDFLYLCPAAPYSG
jgi:quinohemoprotein amine dehydrogenase